MKPFRSEITFTFVAKDMEAASEIDDAVIDAISSITDLPTEGGLLVEMKPQDVIPHSPLAVALAWWVAKGETK